MKFIDMHCDTISRLFEVGRGVEGTGQDEEGRHSENQRERRSEDLRRNEGHLDLERLRAGGCLAQNFALFTDLRRTEDPYGYCKGLGEFFKKEMEQNAGVIRQAVTVADILENERKGRMSAVLTIEEGAVCENDIRILDEFYGMGVRMMTLTWNHENGLAFPNRIDWTSGRTEPETERGLTRRGLEFVERMEELGMVLDVAHLGDAGILQVLDCAKKPFVDSHSNARAISGHARNLTDGMIRGIAERGGVIGINYCPIFLNNAEPDGDRGRSRVSDIVRHIRHMKNVGGIACVGLGSDWDGIRGVLEIGSPAALYRLEEELERQGFTGEEIEKIFYKNVLRLYGDVWK